VTGPWSASGRRAVPGPLPPAGRVRAGNLAVGTPTGALPACRGGPRAPRCGPVLSGCS